MFSAQIETQTETARKDVGALSNDDLVLLIPLLSATKPILLVKEPSDNFKTIHQKLLDDPIEKKQPGRTTEADLLREAVKEEAQKRKLIKVVSVVPEDSSYELTQKATAKHYLIPLWHKRPPLPKPPVRFTILPLPDDVIRLIPDQLSGVGTVINLTRSCKRLYSLFTQKINPVDTVKLSLPFLNHALNHAAVGNWDEVYRLINISPDILLCTGSTSYCGQYHYSGMTIYQVGLKNYENGEKYHKKMLGYFDRLPNGIAEMARQYFEVFPDGKRLRKEWDINEAKRLLDELIKALRQDETLDRNNLEKMSADLGTAYKKYCDYINDTLETGKEGLVCDPEFFADIVVKYIKNDGLGLFTPEQCIFYNVMIWDDFVIKLPKNILRAACQGLYYVVEQKELLNDAGCVLRTGHVVLPLKSDPNFLFGRDFIEMYYGAGLAARTGRGGWGRARSYFQKLCRAKAKEHGTIYAAITETVQQHPCLKPKQE